MCHIAQNFMLIGSTLYGSCTIQPTKVGFSSNELLDMIARCGLNRLKQFSTFLAIHLRQSRNDQKVLAALQNLDEVLYTGLMLGREELDWAHQNGIKLTNMLGNTECGAMLLSVGGTGKDAKFLRPVEGTAYGFWPIASSDAAEDEHVNANAGLLELVVLSESGDCPDPLLRAADGHYHTGDLFQEVAAGSYIFRGRDDDWIKSENSLRCDTKAIEDNVRATCADLVSECIVVGNGRPSPALFLESQAGMTDQMLKKTILRRIRHFHSRRYLHERITSADFIFVVAPGTLPRTATKGNIRRRAVEEAFRRELDLAYGVSH
jgi:acyl-coenzyme A synthetase/AMP-(fatty) acid ligase